MFADDELERIQKKFAALFLNRFFPCVHYSYVSEHLKIHNLRKRMYHVDALFFTKAYFDPKFGSSLLVTVVLRNVDR
jgi:hypothetical protein